MSDPVIEFRGVSKRFTSPSGATVTAVDDVSLSVTEGETLCLIGTSGSGKTTAMKMLNRLIDPSDGELLVEGEEVRTLDPIALRRRMGYVVQKGGLFPHMTAGENIGLLARLEGWDPARIEARVAELLTLVNLPPRDYADRYPRELSGGQRQRVGVARALILDPPFVLMDEPFGALDPITREQIHREFLELESVVNKTVVLVTHDMDEAFALGDRIALMDAGRLVQVGTERELCEQPANDFVREFLRGHLSEGSGGDEA